MCSLVLPVLPVLDRSILPLCFLDKRTDVGAGVGHVREWCARVGDSVTIHSCLARFDYDGKAHQL